MKIDIIGHRGYRAKYPENTILSFRKAVEAGSDGIELDIRLSKDNEVIVFHDNKLERATNGKGDVSGFTIDELKRLDAGNGEKIPTLKEVLSCFKKIKILIEIKKIDNNLKLICEKAVRLAKENQNRNKIVYVSFEPEILKIIKGIDRKAETGLIFSKPWASLDRTVEFYSYINVLCPRNNRIDVGVSSYAHINHLDLYVWTINAKTELDEINKYTPTGIVTDNPELLINKISRPLGSRFYPAEGGIKGA